MKCSVLALIGSTGMVTAFAPPLARVGTTPSDMLIRSKIMSSPGAMTPEIEEMTNGETSSTAVLDKKSKPTPEWAQPVEEDKDRSERFSLDISKTIYTSSVKAPNDAYFAFAETGASNAHMSKHKILHQAILGGSFVGFGGLLALSIAGNIGGIAAANPGIVKMTFAALFPVNLLICVTTGAQLFTGNTATSAAARFEGLIDTRELLKSLFVSLTGNVIGCGLFALAAYYCGFLTGGTAALCSKMAVGKVSAAFGPTFVKAILCNWMVTLAVFLAGACNDMVGKLVACWFPISTFVAIGLEHSIANLFLFPAALCLKAVTFKAVLLKNLVPVLLGNYVAGSLLVGASYSYQFGKLGQKARAAQKLKKQAYDEKKAARAAAIAASS